VKRRTVDTFEPIIDTWRRSSTRCLWSRKLLSSSENWADMRSSVQCNLQGRVGMSRAFGPKATRARSTAGFPTLVPLPGNCRAQPHARWENALPEACDCGVLSATRASSRPSPLNGTRCSRRRRGGDLRRGEGRENGGPTGRSVGVLYRSPKGPTLAPAESLAFSVGCLGAEESAFRSVGTSSGR
jgi:hypothetical protein